jgi:tetratricopeptide (TPR) repeat protein
LTARFELQDKVASSVAGVIEPALQAAETARSANRPTNDLTAYDLYLRAHAMLLSSARQIPQALRLLEQAMVLDPRYGPALAYAAICCFRLVVDGRSEDPEGDRLKGMDFARRALEVASDDPGVLVNAAHALAYFGEDIGAMIALVERATALIEEHPYAKVACCGLAFKANVDDLRESPALEVARELASRYGERIKIVEPNIRHLPSEIAELGAELIDLDEAIRTCEVAIVLVDHDHFKMVPLAERRHLAVIDTRGIWQDMPVPEMSVGRAS